MYCWFTSFIGYPNFFKASGHSADLAQTFLTLAKASLEGMKYSDAKSLFPNLDPAQVETKKAAFQEYGLLYVIPRSNVITLTPVGRQIFELSSSPEGRRHHRRTIVITLCHALARYQFNNPQPVGGNRFRQRANSFDVLPYLACFYLLLKLDGILTVSELRGAVFGLQKMAELRDLEARILRGRKVRTQFVSLDCLPANSRTADNLKIYFMSHLSLDGEILQSTSTDVCGIQEQAYELTQFGFELVESVISEYWPRWRNSSSTIPKGSIYGDAQDYFDNAIGRQFSAEMAQKDFRRAEASSARATKGVLDQYAIDSLRTLPRRIYREGYRKLIHHVRLEKVRSRALVRDAKRQFKKKHGRFYCEVCTFDFEREYGQRGKNFIEAHHKFPIAELKGEVSRTVDDLAMVCSNCHSMLHLSPWITTEQLRSIVLKLRV